MMTTEHERQVFQANLDEFWKRVSIICSLEIGNKIGSKEAYSRIKELWKKLKKSKKGLHIGDEQDV